MQYNHFRGPLAAMFLMTFGSQALAESGHSWGYEGNSGPDYWHDMSHDNEICKMGMQQSPIDLDNQVHAHSGALDLHWNLKAKWTLVNNGHTIQANPDNGGYVMIEGMRYDLLQFHFHTPSEHALFGMRTEMEAHFVHQAASGALAVVGVMIQGGGHNDAFSRMMSAAPHGESNNGYGMVNLVELLPNDERFLRYQGSLTTPPCSETVLWSVLEQPLKVSQDAIEQFKSIFYFNARPLQPLNRRFILVN